MTGDNGDDPLTTELSLGGTRTSLLRYGENSHQQAGLYRLGSRQTRPGVLTATQIQGKPLSYNNINDTDAAFELVAEFDVPTIAIIKHANPCGVASAASMDAAWDAALACDPVSAFGGIIALNRSLDAATATRITSIFTEVIIAPDADDAAREIIASKPNLRLLLTGGMPDPAAAGMMVKSVAGGFLAQSRDGGRVTAEDLKCVTRRQPTDREIGDMIFAMRVAKHVKSNAIVYARNEATVGIGAGQMSRLDSSRIAAQKAADLAREQGLEQSPIITVVASDAFFPFADGLLAAASAGATAVIQPGGSIKDDEVIAAADEAGWPWSLPACGISATRTARGFRHFPHHRRQGQFGKLDLFNPAIARRQWHLPVKHSFFNCQMQPEMGKDMLHPCITALRRRCLSQNSRNRQTSIKRVILPGRIAISPVTAREDQHAAKQSPIGPFFKQHPAAAIVQHQHNTMALRLRLFRQFARQCGHLPLRPRQVS